jgi:hypothetical protein
MDVFISWSGHRGEMVAKALAELLPDAIQDLNAWMSAHDIGAGARWGHELHQQLESSNFGILCLTSENIGAPWLLYEAGSLAKSVSDARVVPYRLNLAAADVPFPLAQFQGVDADEGGTKKLIESLNAGLKQPMDQGRLDRVFQRWWPDLRERIATIPASAEGPRVHRPDRELLEEILKVTRNNAQTIIKDEIKEGVFEAISTSLHYGSYMSNADAFSIASKWIIDHLNSNLNEEVTLDIKVTVVGMAYSWPGFVDKIPAWLDQHNKCNINIEMLLVSPDYLRRLPIANSPKDWADESQRRVIDLNKLVDGLPPQNRKRLSCAIKTYEAIPQYHGILINNDQLFLGRTDWKYDNCPSKDPELTVGQNRYRYFNRATTQGHDRGSERVDLFLHWHRFYWHYQSETVLVFKNGEACEDSKLPTR